MKKFSMIILLALVAGVTPATTLTGFYVGGGRGGFAVGAGFGYPYGYWGRPGWGWGWGGYYTQPVVVQKQVVVEKPRTQVTVKRPSSPRPVKVDLINTSNELITVYYDKTREKTLAPQESTSILRRSCKYDVLYRRSGEKKSFVNCDEVIEIE